jgi:hypothetical protein
MGRTAPSFPVYDQWVDAVDALVRVGLQVQTSKDHAGVYVVQTPDGTMVGGIVAEVDRWQVVWI